MKRLVPLPLLTVCVLALTGAAQEGKEGEIKGSSEFLEKRWGIQVKNIRVDDKKTGNRRISEWAEVRLTLEFGKDVEELQSMRQSFSPGPGDGKGNRVILCYYLFDKENVSLTKVYLEQTEGELTGKKGDAFRVILKVKPAAVMQKVVRIDIRRVETK